jgi:branched-chain amino acid transport system substrate-binding protein
MLPLFISGCADTAETVETITIGALLPLTGDTADEGIRAFNGLQLAKTEINNNGGIMGKKLDIIVMNDRGDSVEVVRKYRELRDAGVAGIIGSSFSNVTTALAMVAQRDGIPLITPTATDPMVTKRRSNVFRAIYTDDLQAEAMAYFAYHSLGAKTALILQNTSHDDIGRMVTVFTNAFVQHGGEVTATEQFVTTEQFGGILSRYVDNPPDVIFFPEDFISGARVVNMVHYMGLRNTRVLGTDAWDGILAYIINPGAMRRVYYPAAFSFDDPDPATAQFTRNYIQMFSQIPLSGSAAAYNSVLILTEAIEIAGSTNAEDIIAALSENEFNTVTGTISFDEDNNALANVYIIEISDGVYSMSEKVYTGWGERN